MEQRWKDSCTTNVFFFVWGGSCWLWLCKNPNFRIVILQNHNSNESKKVLRIVMLSFFGTSFLGVPYNFHHDSSVHLGRERVIF